MMNQGDLFKKIGNILTELQDQYQYLAENPQDLNELELELFLSNANFLTDHIHIVIKANSHHEVKAIAAPAAKTAKSGANEETYKHDKEPATFEFLISDHARQEKFEFEEKEVKEIFNRPLTPEEQQIIAQKQTPPSKEAQAIITAEEVKPPQELKPVTGINPVQALKREEPLTVEIVKEELIKEELLKEEPAKKEPQKEEVVKVAPIKEAPQKSPVAEAPVKLTLNEMLASGRSANGNAEPVRVEIKDLKQAISLNDKLLFIKDLFHGYGLAYAEVIELVNKMPDFKTADAFLQKNYAIINDWKSKQETVDRFYDLLKRRFPVK